MFGFGHIEANWNTSYPYSLIDQKKTNKQKKTALIYGNNHVYFQQSMS